MAFMSKKAKCPPWADKALQGLVFWIGHRQALYSKYPLSEGALVAETCNLIFANLLPNEVLLCEVRYTDLVPLGNNLGKIRADLVVASDINGLPLRKAGSLQSSATAVIEVKRAKSPPAEIDKDLKRLASIKSINPSLRAFLFVVSESKQPARFVFKNGAARRGKHPIPTESFSYYRVRRSCKATYSFFSHKYAHYACIIEVFNEPGPIGPE
jgi:hypothetical protein